MKVNPEGVKRKLDLGDGKSIISCILCVTDKILNFIGQRF